MKYYKIEVERTYTTEVVVKCKDEKTVQRILDATPSRRDDWDIRTNLWDCILEEEMQQTNVTEQVATVDVCIEKDPYINFDLDKQIED